jgi:hypothetical protein
MPPSPVRVPWDLDLGFQYLKPQAPVPAPVPGSVPVPAPVVTSNSCRPTAPPNDPTPVAAPQTLPSPPSSTAEGTPDYGCGELMAQAATMLNVRYRSTQQQPSCRCMTLDNVTYAGVCDDAQRLCSTLDNSYCGTQSSFFSYGNDYKGYRFTHDNGIKVWLIKDVEGDLPSHH